MSTVETATAIRRFHAEFSEAQIDDLRRRIAATRWPSKELVGDRTPLTVAGEFTSQGSA